MDFQENVVLAPYTTFKIGGPARWFAEAVVEEDLTEGLGFARDHHLPIFVLGGGSNLLVSDQGFPGLVLHVVLKGMERSQAGGRVRFRVAAGEIWDEFVAEAVASDCAGVECLSGIPGSVGGTPVQNVGAYGQEVSQSIVSVRALDRNSLEFVELGNADCAFGYRSSAFNSTLPGRYILTQVEFALEQHGRPSLRYEDLKRAMDGREPTLKEARSAVRAIRRRKGMLIVEEDPDSRSAGSFFHNPVIPAEQLGRLAVAAGIEPDRVPHYPAGAGRVKVAAAWLLEHSGFQKGYVMGRAGISTRHSLALINRQGATASEILALRDQIRAAVEARFGIYLEMEPVSVG